MIELRALQLVTELHRNAQGVVTASVSYIVGESGVIEIREHRPEFSGDRFYYDVLFEDGEVRRLFDFVQARFAKDEYEREHFWPVEIKG